MDYPEHRQLFTVKEFSHACGVSRTSLIRMEESGFLTPCRIDADTGYRYYDAYNAAQVGQYQLLQTLGLSREKCADYYHRRVDSRAFLREQRERLSRMQRILEELELRHDESRQLSFSFFDLPETVCYCVTTEVSSQKEVEAFFYAVHGQSIREGFRLLGTEPMFAISAGDWRTYSAQPSARHEITACIPVVPAGEDDPRLTVFPAVHAFSALAYGDYPVLYELSERLWREVDARKLRPVGPARFIALVAPFVGEHIAPKDFCFRIIVPVEE